MSTKYKEHSQQQHSIFIENECRDDFKRLTCILTPENLDFLTEKIRDSKIGRKYGFFIYVKKYATSRKNLFEIYNLLNRDLYLKAISNLKIDFCNNVIAKNELTLTSFSKNDLKNFAKNQYSILQNDKFSNINSNKTTIKNEMLKLDTQGCFKMNYYTTFITKIIPNMKLKFKTPDSTLTFVANNFYGKSLLYINNQKTILDKIKNIKNGLDTLPNMNFGYRIEQNVIFTNIFDSSIYIEDF